MKTEAKIGVRLPEAKGILRPLEEARKESSLELSEEAWPCGHLDFRLLASGIVRINFYCFKPSCLWHFVSKALRN